jgi:hypothetical protein
MQVGRLPQRTRTGFACVDGRAATSLLSLGSDVTAARDGRDRQDTVTR